MQSVSNLITGSILSQIITLLTMPILSRIYSPSVVGSSTSIISIITILGTIACLRYDAAIMVCNKQDEALDVSIMSIIIALIFSIIIGLILFLGKINIFIQNKIVHQYYNWYILPIGVFVIAIQNVLNTYISKKGKFSIIAISKILSSIFTFTFLYFGAYIGDASAKERINMLILASLVVDIYLIINVIEYHTLPNISYLYNLLKKYYKSLLDLIATSFNVLSWQIVPIVISFFFGAKEVGYYSFGLRLIQMPISLIGNSIGQVFQKKASELPKKYLYEETIKIIRNIIKLTWGPALILLFFSPKIFNIVFGAEWLPAGIYTQILVPWSFVWFLITPLGGLYYILGRQKQYAIFQILNFLSRISAVFIGYLYKNIIIALWLFTINGIIVYGIMLIYLIIELKRLRNA